VVIDYLQLIESNARENRQQAVSEISRSIKKLAMELEVPIIALSQLSRGVDERQNRRPILSDLRESGSLEQDADIVGFLYREDYYDRDMENEFFPELSEPVQNEVSQVELIIEKNRQGARETVHLSYNLPMQRFSSISYANPQVPPPLPSSGQSVAKMIDDIEKRNENG
jgi:replicative DNA helicase